MHHACTIVARNYTASARVLARSLGDHHASLPLTTLLIDGTDSDRSTEGIGRVLLPADLAVDRANLHRMRTFYDVVEFATALKPALLMHLLRSGARSATYLDPDIRVYAGLDDVLDSAAEHGLALTPHTVAPLPRDGWWPNEATIMHAGIYNLGFVSAGPDAYPFLIWWADRLLTDAVVDPTNALFTDQRWVDWATALTAPTVLRDTSLNVAYWNLHERQVTRHDDGWWVGSQPLRFFHFSGYDPAVPWVLSRFQGSTPRNLLSASPPLRRLCDDYANELVAAGHEETMALPYRYSRLPGGLNLTPVVRRLYREALLAGDGHEVGSAPDPWDEPDRFLAWLLEPELEVGHLRIGRFEHAIWRARDDLRVRFPDPLGADAGRFRDWLDSDSTTAPYYAGIGVRSRGEDRRRQTPRRHPFPKGGCSVVRFAHAGARVSEMARRLSNGLARAGYPWEAVEVPAGRPVRTGPRPDGPAPAPGYDTVLLFAERDETVRLSATLELGPGQHRRIGYWSWEHGPFPEHLAAALATVDEVWVPSEFARYAVAGATDTPIRVVPLPASIPVRHTRFTREQLGIPPDRTAFLVDVTAVDRQNVMGVLDAYRLAFPRGEATCLVVRWPDGTQMLDRERIRLAADRQDILLVDRPMAAAQALGMLELVDCVVSLHHAEAFGLHLLDAMARRTPVVATGYSGNMSFMDPTTAFLVPYELGKPHGDGPAGADGALWAEPDLERAAEALRIVATDRDQVAAVTAAAIERVRSFSADRITQHLLPYLLARGVGDETPKVGP